MAILYICGSCKHEFESKDQSDSVHAICPMCNSEAKLKPPPPEAKPSFFNPDQQTLELRSINATGILILGAIVCSLFLELGLLICFLGILAKVFVWLCWLDPKEQAKEQDWWSLRN